MKRRQWNSTLPVSTKGLSRGAKLAPKRGSPTKRGGKLFKSRGATKAKKAKRYAAYLRSATWKRKRAACIEAAGGRCEMTLFLPLVGGLLGTEVRCPATEHLTAHHTTYARFGGEELPQDLLCLCRSCHNRVEALKGRRIA